MQESHSVTKAAGQPAAVKSILISLLRQPGQIIALLSDEIDGVLQNGFREVSLDTLDTGLFPEARSLKADWHSLQGARELSCVWPAFWRVFWMTVQDTANTLTCAVPHLTMVKPPVATAANPRAFRGTRYQPPKQAKPELDLCSLLADQRLLDAFFARHDFTNLPVLGADGKALSLPVTAKPSCTSLLFSSWQTPLQALPVFPDAFRRNFLWRLRGCSAVLQLAWLQFWRQVNSLHTGEELRSENLQLLARLCALNATQIYAIELALLLPARRLTIFLRLLASEMHGALSLSQMTDTQLMQLDALTQDDQRFEFYLRSVLRNLSKNVSVKYSLAGCLLFEVSGETELRGYVLIADKDCNDVPVEAIAKACDVAGIRSWVSLWNYCADLPGLSRLLHETRWEKFNQDAAHTWLNIMYSFMGKENKNQLQEKWQVYLKIFCVCHEALIALPLERQNKLALMWSRFVEGWDDVLSLSKAAQDFLPLIYKLCLPPFSSTIDYGHSFVNIVETWPENERQEILNLDNLVWRHFERACRRQDNANLIVFGTYAFSTVSPFFLRNSMLHAPVRLFKTMRLLGSMAGERRQSFMRTQIKTEWFSRDWNVMPPQAACLRLLALSSAAGLDSPLPRRLREYFDGQLDLSSLQILRHCKVALSRLPSLRLQALEAAFWKEVDAPFRLHDHSASARHALRLLASLNGRFTQNRKGLRRFLSNVTAGNSLNFLDHPLNLRWYAKHPRVQRHLWHTGLKRTVHSAWGDLSLAFEYDPFEILMMGTYVDSCLGVGGICDYSTVACLLDANKQVLYARNSYGKVVARQLLAIDEADQLVCFAVYPENTPQEIKAAFKSYDLELAVHLSLPMYQEKADSSYDITTILAQSWWDDGPWLEE